MRNFLLAMVVAGLLSSPAMASPYTLSGTVEYTSVTGNLAFSGIPAVPSVDVYISPLYETITDQAPPNISLPGVTLYCVDIYNDYFSGGTFNLVATPVISNSITTGEILALLEHAPTAAQGADNPGAVAAIQAAIWELEYGSDLTISQNTGSSNFNSYLVADLLNITNGTWTPDYSNSIEEYESVGLPVNQNFVVLNIGGGGGGNPLPEPFSLAITGTGLVGLFLVRRRRKAR